MTYGPGVLDRWASGAVRDREVLKPLWAVCDGGRSGKRPDLETIWSYSQASHSKGGEEIDLLRLCI